MFKRINIICLLVLSLILSLASITQAQTIAGTTTQEETLLGRSIISGYYAIYSNDNGATYKAEEIPGNPIAVTLGQSKSVQQPFGAPIDLKNVKELTHINIKGPGEVTDEFFTKNGTNHIWNPVVNNKDDFDFYYTKHIPDGFNLTGTGDLATGKVDVQWGFNINKLPPDLSSVAVDVTAASGLGSYYVDTWSKTPFATASKAWLWTLPVVIEWYGIPNELPNLMVAEFESGVTGQAEPGQKYTATVNFSNQSGQTLTNIPVAAYNNGWEATLKDKNGNELPRVDFLYRIDLGPFETITCTFYFTALEGGNTLEAVIDTAPLPATVNETTKDDNKADITVDVKAVTPPPAGDGTLKVTAVNQSKSKARPVGTARWTDWVTIKLDVPAPTPPKGTLKSWSITSATLTYPKKHPEFTFGTPYPPQGTRTVNMSTGGHSSTVTIKEDWGMDGANIYSVIEETLMASKPKNYAISANYNINYTYEYQVRHRSCSGSGENRSCRTWYETKTGSGSTSGSASGTILVNGTGVDSQST